MKKTLLFIVILGLGLLLSYACSKKSNSNSNPYSPPPYTPPTYTYFPGSIIFVTNNVTNNFSTSSWAEYSSITNASIIEGYNNTLSSFIFLGFIGNSTGAKTFATSLAVIYLYNISNPSNFYFGTNSYSFNITAFGTYVNTHVTGTFTGNMTNFYRHSKANITYGSFDVPLIYVY